MLYCLGAVSAVMLSASCSDVNTENKDDKAGVVSEIKLDRSKLGSGQPFTISANYIAGKSDRSIMVKDEYGISHEMKVEGNIAKCKLAGVASGKHTYEIVVNATSGQETYPVGFSVEQADVRNSFWSDNKEITEENMPGGKVDGSVYMLTEKEFYSHGYFYTDSMNGSIETSSNPRYVFYYFDAEDKLESVRYAVPVPDTVNKNFAKYMLLHANKISKMEVMTLDGFSFRENSAITEEERTVADKFVSSKGVLTTEEEGVIAEAVKTGKLALIMNLKGAKTTCTMQYNKSEKGGFIIAYIFTPVK